MNSSRDRALQLRLKGLSYTEIQRQLGIPKSTLSGWFKGVILSETARMRLAMRTRSGSQVLIQRNKMQTHVAERRAKETRARGRAAIHALDTYDLLLVGAALYWAEGYKRPKVVDGKPRTHHTVRFVNSDSGMVAIFMRFLRENLGIPEYKIRISMRLYPHINERAARLFWSRIANVKEDRFFKTTYLVSGASKGKRPFNRLPWGTLQIEVCDTERFHYLMGLIEGVKEGTAHDRVSSLLG